MGSRADARFRGRGGLSACGRAGLRPPGRGRRPRLSRQRRRARDRDQRPARVHGRDAGRSHARLGRRGPCRVAVLGDPGAGQRRTRRVARRPLADQLRHFWAAETKRRGIRGPEVVERYPYLAGGHPERLPGIDELAALAEDAVIVSTADPFHHGIGYGDPPERALAPDDGGLELARATIGKESRFWVAGTTPATTHTASRRRATLATPASSSATSAGSCRLDRRPDVHRRSGAVRSPGSDVGRRAACRVAAVRARRGLALPTRRLRPRVAGALGTGHRAHGHDAARGRRCDTGALYWL